jgi:hypothetical protein
VSFLMDCLSLFMIFHHFRNVYLSHITLSPSILYVPELALAVISPSDPMNSPVFPNP